MIPFNGYRLMNILGFVFSRVKENTISIYEKIHEQIHTMQQYEILAVSSIVSLVLCNLNGSWWYLLATILLPFVVYVVGWVMEIVLPPYHGISFDFHKDDNFITKFEKIKKTIARICNDAYKDNCFEREAYQNQHDRDYLATRSLFAWTRHILKGSQRKA